MIYTIDTMKKDITKATLFGLATADALGVPLEFLSRKQVRAINPTEMLGCDIPKGFSSVWGDKLPAGTWSDDTSMTIAAMDSFANNGIFDYDDIMNNFMRWHRDGAYTALGYSFDIGGVAFEAIRNYCNGIPATKCGPTGQYDNGNGSLMRILPFSLYCTFKDLWIYETIELINTASGITHGHSISKMGCVIFTLFLKALIRMGSIEEAWEHTRHIDYSEWYDAETVKAYSLLLSPDFINANDSQIGETGYVVDTLMAAVYSILHGQDYESSVLCAISMGFDTDTFAAVTGALAGAFYGFTSIPGRWLAKLAKKPMLEDIAIRFAETFND